jgi:hypothetical protein
MPILFTAFLSLMLAWVRGAPPTDLANVRLRWLPLPILAFAIQLATFVKLEAALHAVAPWLHLVSLTLLAAFFVANLRYRGLVVAGAGLLLNAAVIGLNGGYMPVRPADMERAGFYEVAARLRSEGHFQKSTVLDEGTYLPFLADVIPVPLPNGPDRLISVGDVFIAAGTFLFIQEALVGEKRRGRSRDERGLRLAGATGG